MEIWTRQREQMGWTPWPDMPRGLASLLDVHGAQVLLLTDAPETEHDALVAALKLVHALARDDCNVVVASPHPSAGLIESLASCDVDQVWVVNGRHSRRTAPLENVLGLDHDVCPYLHTSTEDGTTLSVCGSHHDRMVLARHHLDRWCLKNDGNCPHRRHNGSDV